MPSDESKETIKRCLSEFQKNEGRVPTIQELSAVTAIGPGQLRSKIRRIIDESRNSQVDGIKVEDLKLVLKTVAKSAKSSGGKLPAPDVFDLEEVAETHFSAPIENTRIAHTDDLKEVRVNLQAKVAEYQRKIESAKTFLLNGERVRISTLLTQAELSNAESVLAVYDKVLDDLGEVALLEEGPQVSGRTISMILSPA